MTKIVSTIWLAGLLTMAGCQKQEEIVLPAQDLAVLAEWMSGSFSSQEQAEEDSSFFDIRLTMVPVWTDRTDGHWLYVEQAVATHLEKPYRQRVYHLTQVDDTTFNSEVYTMSEPLRFARAWGQPEFFAILTPDSLTTREGCAISLVKQADGSFAGSTTGENCKSDLRGASYATSEVRITASALYSWDRGFDAERKQVWGAETGGYLFKKIVPQAAL